MPAPHTAPVDTPPVDTPPGAVPPPGPGVVVPFPAPPRERNPRIWISLVVLGVVVVLCIGGTVAGFVGLTVHETNQASTAADRFLTAIEKHHYTSAYRMQCAPARQSQTQDEFRDGLANGSRLVSHQLDTPEALDRGDTPGFVVPAELRYADGRSMRQRIAVVSAGSGGGDLEVCGTA
ncbi:MAG: hypothetical protein WCA46_16300 [Actinocatenispora sp.]